MKALFWGFLFGTVGLYLLADLALALGPVEYFANYIFYPGRFLAERYAGPEGSNSEVALLTIANGAIYAFIFWLLAFAFRRKQI